MLLQSTMPPEEFIEQDESEASPSEEVPEETVLPTQIVEESSRTTASVWAEEANVEKSILPDQSKMLDFFPLTQEELRHVLEGYERYDPVSKPTFAELFRSSQLIPSDEDAAAKEEIDFFARRRQVEAEFLPETSLLLQQAIDNVFLLGSGNDDSPVYRFVEAIATLLGRRGSRNLLTVIFQLADTESASTSPTVDSDSIIHLVYRFVLGSSYLRWGQPTLRRMHPKSWVHSLAQRSQEGNGRISLPAWMEWVQSVAPQIDKTVSTFCNYVVFGASHPFRSTHPCLSLPRVLGNSKSAFWTFPYQGIPASLGVLSTTLGGPWVQLYSSDLDGISFRAMQEALLSYFGATVLLIQTTAGDAFGYFTNCPWKESKRWYGQHEATESFLFGLKPSLQYFAPIASSSAGVGMPGGESKPFYMYLNNPVYSHPTDLNGLAIGGINDMTPRIHITTNFEHCKAGTMDGVYASGPLLSDGELFFDIDLVEIYAVSCTAEDFEEGIRRGRACAAVREGTRLKAAQVDRKQFLEDFQTGQYMNQLFLHRDQTRGRHSFVTHEDGSSGYFVESKAPSVRRLQVDDDDE
jgi:hypothetical protein